MGPEDSVSGVRAFARWILLTRHTWNLADLMSSVDMFKEMHHMVESPEEENASNEAALTTAIAGGLHSRRQCGWSRKTSMHMC